MPETPRPSGLKESFSNIDANQLLVVKESKGIIEQQQFGRAKR